MRRWAFVVVIIGILILFGILFFTKETEISEQKELEKLMENEKVRVIGTIEEERNWGNEKLLILDNEIEVISDLGKLEGKKIEIHGTVDDFEKKRIRAIKIVVLE